MATVSEIPLEAANIEAPIEAEPDGLFEFVDGHFVEKTLGASELELANVLAEMLNAYVKPNRLGRVRIEVIFRLKTSPRLDRRPDVAFVSESTWPADRRILPASAWEAVPDLAVEIVSPTNRTNADTQKIHEYFRAGSKAVWVIYPDLATIYVYSNPKTVTILTHGDTLDASPVIPGFTIDLGAFFGPQAEETA